MRTGKLDVSEMATCKHANFSLLILKTNSWLSARLFIYCLNSSADIYNVHYPIYHAKVWVSNKSLKLNKAAFI